jgi:hypothetical protein
MADNIESLSLARYQAATGPALARFATELGERLPADWHTGSDRFRVWASEPIGGLRFSAAASRPVPDRVVR